MPKFNHRRSSNLTIAASLLFANSISCTSTAPARSAVASTEPTIRVGETTITISTSEKLPVSTDEMKQWINRAATAVTAFYDRFPVKAVSIIITPANTGDIKGGMETDGQKIEIQLGPDTTHATLQDDWTMTHEMFHLSQPDVDDQYKWMSEGMADYLEPVARVRIGQITPEKFWQDLVEGLPQAISQPGESGLDQTHSWASTYWGGCLFWLLADIRVREQTQNTKSVRDAARAVLDAGGDGTTEWPIDRLLAAYDKGTGTKVFTQLHDELGNKPVSINLPKLWKSLGINYQNGKIIFDDRAPSSNIRKAITVR